MEWTHTVTAVFLGLGCLFSLAGSVGLLRFPDFYSRLHAAGKTDSLAQMLILGGLLFVSPDWGVSARLAIIAVILFFTAPTATHAITKAARLDGLEPWTKEDANHE
ncbi:MAG: monovalent cation/H(+) antiporter subunit G [Myxococcales bacterium]|jgi:multicomponent Na+:H+ antiporter subunit G|nr:monovalent cation/H(+) antiporter subunit G [Myxococcales bacterium]